MEEALKDDLLQGTRPFAHLPASSRAAHSTSPKLGDCRHSNGAVSGALENPLCLST